MDRNQGDINPLTDLGETDFTDDLIDFFEQKLPPKPIKDDGVRRQENISVPINQNLNPKKMEILSHPVQVARQTPEQIEFVSKEQNSKLKLSPEQEKSIPDVIDGFNLSKKDKQSLFFDKFQPVDKDVYYFVDKNQIIAKNDGKELENGVKFVSFDSVKFDMKKTELNLDNFDYLKNSLKYLGFGENLNSALEARMREGADKFTLGATAEFSTPIAKDLINYELRFSKSTTSDKYFLNNYQASLEKGLKDGKFDSPVNQVFFLNKGNDITAKEAYNLLSGRAIQKKAELGGKVIDGQETPKRKEEIWVKLDFEKKNEQGNSPFKTFHKEYGFDLQASLQKHPIKELNDPDKRERLISSLNRGNLQAVTFEKSSGEEKGYVSANPQYKNLNIYDKDMKLQFEKKEDIKVDNQETKTPSRGR